MVDSNANHLAKNHVHRFIHYDFDDHKKDFAHACNIYNLLQTREVHVDGCVTFWEDCVPLAALVNKMVGSKGLYHVLNVLQQRVSSAVWRPRLHLSVFIFFLVFRDQ